MEYNGVKIDWIGQWILSYLKESDSWESTSSISSALSIYDGVTDTKVRRRLRKIRDAGLVACESKHRENVADANLYRTNPNSLDDLDSLSSPPSTSEQHVRELEQKVEELQVENNRLKSDVRQLKSQFETMNNMFTGRTDRIAQMQENQDYLMEHAEVERRRWDALEDLLADDDVELKAYF